MAKTQPKAEPPVLGFESREAFEAYVEAQTDGLGIWLKLAKKGTGVPSVTYEEALDVALCHGWIDGQAKRLDATHYLQRFCPRRPRSLWSKRNVEKVARLEAEGRMRAGGRREVEAAKADGRWEAAYAGPATIEVPPELAAALAERPEARAFFETLDRTSRYAACFAVHTAKREETKRARAAKLVERFVRGEKPG